MGRIVFHIDVNSAFLSWTAVERLKEGSDIDLRTIPSAVGGDEKSRRGVILAKSESAKKFGVVTGESIYTAKKKCPQLSVAGPNFYLYKKCSMEMMNILKEYSPIMQQYSIDECFLEFRDLIDERDESLKLAYEIKERIKNELGFTVNIGISTNKLLAKMASDFSKPDKIHVLYKDQIKSKMWPLPVERLFMVGKKSVPRLNDLNIFTIGDLARYDKEILVEKFKSFGYTMHNYANGIDDSQVQEQMSEYKGISNSVTLENDVYLKEDAHEILKKLVDTTTLRLRKMNKFAYTVTVSIRNKDFNNYSHSRKLKVATDSTKIIYNSIIELFDEIWKGDYIRLLGVSLTQLVENQVEQLSFFSIDNNEMKSQKILDETIDGINKKYGKTIVYRN